MSPPVVPTVDVQEAAARDAGTVLLDVREVVEWLAGHAPHAVHVPLAELPDALLDLDPERPVVCICRSGNRSASATQFLRQHGYDAVNMAGGMRAWAAEGLAVVTDDGQPGRVA
jgi:rhodanese-related sulfurtransferase